MENGIVLIDKPAGITTFDIIRKLRKTLGVKKMGHAGVLDKMATGLVVIALGKATKLLSIFENGYKVYEAEFTFGLTTDTYDLYGKVLDKKEIVEIEESKLSSIIKNFTGEIEQTPPPYSNIKIKGKRLYKYALKNETVELPKRKVRIFNFELLDIKKNKARFKIKCSKGTYIRSLAHDIGKELGCGGVVSSLRRTEIYPFKINEASTIDNPKILSVQKTLQFMNEIVVDSDLITNIKNGVQICKMLDCKQLKERYYHLIDTNFTSIAIIEKKNENYSYKAIL